MTRTQVTRWRVALVATLALVALGLLYANATLLAATLIPLSYVFYGTLSGLPEQHALAVERDLDPATPEPGAVVGMTLTVENTGERVLSDVRIVDGVPDELAVIEGTPRLCASLSPGERATLQYSVVARRGTYAFEKPVARLRSLAGSNRRTRELDAAGDDELVCVTAVDTTLRQARSTPHTGAVTTDSGGSGLEFHSTRQYRQGDPVNRIDWHHVAKTGEFITVQYREQKTSRTVLVVDARPVARVTPAPGYPTALDRSVYATERLYETLTAAGVETTVAVLGLDEESAEHVAFDPAGIVWAGPDRDTSPEAVFDALVRAPAVADQPRSSPPSIGFGAESDGERSPRTAGRTRDEGARRGESSPDTSVRTDGGGVTTALVSGVPGDARVLLCSPLVDNWPVQFCRALAGEHELVVVSPDPVGAETTGQRLADLHRRLRLREIQRVRGSTVDWAVEQPFETALREAVPMLLTRH